jgi:DNA-binding Lrp family transcriptional regulator
MESFKETELEYVIPKDLIDKDKLLKLIKKNVASFQMSNVSEAIKLPQYEVHHQDGTITPYDSIKEISNAMNIKPSSVFRLVEKYKVKGVMDTITKVDNIYSFKYNSTLYQGNTLKELSTKSNIHINNVYKIFNN